MLRVVAVGILMDLLEDEVEIVRVRLGQLLILIEAELLENLYIAVLA